MLFVHFLGPCTQLVCACSCFLCGQFSCFPHIYTHIHTLETVDDNHRWLQSYTIFQPDKKIKHQHTHTLTFWCDWRNSNEILFTSENCAFVHVAFMRPTEMMAHDKLDYFRIMKHFVTLWKMIKKIKKNAPHKKWSKKKIGQRSNHNNSNSSSSGSCSLPVEFVQQNENYCV